MKNQDAQQSVKVVEQTANGKTAPKGGLLFLILTTAVIASWGMISSCASSSRPSTQSEIAAQKEFQAEWSKTQKEASQKWDSTLKSNKKPY